jgi:ribosome-associated protein
MRDIATKDGSIRLGQFLKLAGAVDSGADVKSLLVAGRVRVNNEVELRRGRQLIRGDVVRIADEELRVA